MDIGDQGKIYPVFIHPAQQALAIITMQAFERPVAYKRININ
jgi:hypothetical protein